MALISIVIPCYNEQEVLPALADRLREATRGWDDEWEAILVNDGSVDATMQIATELCASDARFGVVELSRNFGHQAAVTVGLLMASGDCVIVIDADLQDPPELLSEFVAKWRQGYDVVYGVRTRRQGSLLMRAAYKIYYRILAHLSSLAIPLDSGDFCLISRRAVDAICALPERNRFVRGLRTWVGFSQAAVGYDRKLRAAGRPKYSVSKLVRLGMSGVLGFSTAPLRWATYAGLVSCLLSVGAGFAFLFNRVTGIGPFGYKISVTPGTATLTVSMFFLSGVQMLLIGIVGEYVALLTEEAKRRPVAIVKHVMGLRERSGLHAAAHGLVYMSSGGAIHSAESGSSFDTG